MRSLKHKTLVLVTAAVVLIGVTLIIVGADTAHKGIISTFVIDAVTTNGDTLGHYVHTYTSQYYFGITMEILGLIIVPSSLIITLIILNKDRTKSVFRAMSEALNGTQRVSSSSMFRRPSSRMEKVGEVMRKYFPLCPVCGSSHGYISSEHLGEKIATCRECKAEWGSRQFDTDEPLEERPQITNTLNWWALPSPSIFGKAVPLP